MRDRLEYQAGHAIVWRDAICILPQLCGIPDEKGRAGHYPGRVEAEDARLTGYKVIDVTPWEDASRAEGGELQTSRHAPRSGPTPVQAGRFDIAVQYFDLQGGAAHFTLQVNGRPAEMARRCHATLAPPQRRQLHPICCHGVELKPGDVLRIEGVPDKNDPAALDYIELSPSTAGTRRQ